MAGRAASFGLLLDRADPRSDNLHMDVPSVEYEKLSDDRLGEPSANFRKRVEAARERQRVDMSSLAPRERGGFLH